MNIFALDKNPVQAAKWQCNKHVIKMIVESCQMMCGVYHAQGIEAPYKKTHFNHPCSKWSRSSYYNFLWLIEHTYALCAEYTERYKRVHKSQAIVDWCEENSWQLKFDKEELEPFALAINEDSKCRLLPEFDEGDPISCYRLFYKHDKSHLHAWKQNKPSWIL